MSSSSNEVHSPRSWWSLIAGVAVVSSALTTLSILGFQSVHRRNKRHELEEEIRRATKNSSQGRSGSVHAVKSNESKGELGEQNDKKMDEHPSEARVPKYLAALAASQQGLKHQSRPGSPKPTPRQSAIHHQELKRQPSLHLKPSLSAGSSSSPRKGSRINTSAYDESLIREQLSRNYSFLGEEAMGKVRNAFVIVVGAGGVGSWCALMLLRSGVGKIRLIDFDQVSLSSLNRHACAKLADVGRPKVIVCKEHFEEIAPWAEIDARVEIFRDAEARKLLGPFDTGNEHINPTYIVDAIDNLDTKIDLLAYCYKNKIKCFSSMGAGAKADPSQIQVAELNMTAEDPLARTVRRGLRSKGIWTAGAIPPPRRRARKPRERETTVKASDLKSNLLQEDEEKKRQSDYQAALEKLEANGSPVTRRRLTASGRGAEEKEEYEKSTIKRDSLTNGAEIGFSRYNTSRRASSSSSMGSAQFFSPVTTPDGDGSRSFDNIHAETQRETVTDQEPNHLENFYIEENIILKESQDGVRNKKQDEKQEGEMDGYQDVTYPQIVPQRPPLSTLITRESSTAASSEASGSRASSLQELVAEDLKSAHSGEQARRSASDLNHSIQLVEKSDEVNGDDNEEEKPFKIMCVFSNEKSDTRLLPLDEEEFQRGKVEELAALEDFRVRILPVLGPLPAMFGLAAATYILCDIAGKELETLPWKSRKKTYERLWTDLEKMERRYPVPGGKHDSSDVALGPRRIPWSIEDVGYVYEEVYRGRSVVPPFETLTTGKLIRWDSTLPLSYSNVALFSRAQGKKHEEEVLKHNKSPVDIWGDETHTMFKRRMAEERRMGLLR